RVVGDIDVMRIRPGGDDLTQDGEPAEAGIEHQNRWRRWHGAILADPRVPFTVFAAWRGQGWPTRLRAYDCTLPLIEPCADHNFAQACTLCGIRGHGHPCRKILFCCPTGQEIVLQSCSRPMSGACFRRSTCR